MIPNTMGDRIDLEAANVSEIQIGISPLYPPPDYITDYIREESYMTRFPIHDSKNEPSILASGRSANWQQSYKLQSFIRIRRFFMVMNFDRLNRNVSMKK